jgi:hypothetical protein
MPPHLDFVLAAIAGVGRVYHTNGEPQHPCRDPLKRVGRGVIERSHGSVLLLPITDPSRLVDPAIAYEIGPASPTGLNVTSFRDLSTRMRHLVGLPCTPMPHGALINAEIMILYISGALDCVRGRVGRLTRDDWLTGPIPHPPVAGEKNCAFLRALSSFLRSVWESMRPVAEAALVATWKSP